MNSFRRSFLFIGFIFFMLSLFSQTDKYLIEAESFQFKGKWYVEENTDCFGNNMLRVLHDDITTSQMDALTAVQIRSSGEYSVWVRSYDQTEGQGTRLFRLSVDEQAMNISGNHGHTGFYWEHVGKINLTAKRVLLRLHDVSNNYGRCDAILLVKDSTINPNDLGESELLRWEKDPVIIESGISNANSISDPITLSGEDSLVASIKNDSLKISFVKSHSQSDRLACCMEVKTDSGWTQFHKNIEDNKVFLVSSSSDDGFVACDPFFPEWKENSVYRNFTYNGVNIIAHSDSDYQNPFYAGKLSEAIPISASVVSDSVLQVNYSTDEGSQITGFWTLTKNSFFVKVKLVCKAANYGMYSMGIMALQPIPEAEMGNVLVPPMFQYKRIPINPILMTSTLSPQPLAMAELNKQSGVITSFVSGDDTTFPQDWGDRKLSQMGFSIKNYKNEIQPSVFSPILGMSDSYVVSGGQLERNFIVGIFPKSWNKTLEYISDNIYKVTDYRSQDDASLSETLFNISDLMADSTDDNYAGWDKSMKGFYDIECPATAAPTVVQASPLSVIAASVISKNENLYLSRALPTIEYTLSRSGFRWSTTETRQVTTDELPMNPFTSEFPTSYYCSLNQILGNVNPWLSKIAIPNNSLRTGKGYSCNLLSWVQSMWAYKLTGDNTWLSKAIQGANSYIDEYIYNNTTVPLDYQNFYNTKMYSAWWDLLDIYDITHDKKYLEAAQYGAAHTLAGIKCFPKVANGMQTIHPGGVYVGNTTIWWKGMEKFRLGFPRVAGDSPQKDVEAWTVSSVGLGMEQPSTYMGTWNGSGLISPIFMCNWAPALLNLSSLSGKSIYETYARNGVIGRFANYPGYYATGYTDIPMSADFPYKGPDVSSIYYHHIPAHLSFVADYLITEAEERSKGNVSFPYGRQEGFVWFSNRIYGGLPGRIFNDTTASLWMKRGLVTINVPSVNFVTALSEHNFWIILSGESHAQTDLTMTIGDEIYKKLASNMVTVYADDGTKSSASIVGKELELLMPAKGFLALAFPLNVSVKNDTCPVLQDGMQVVDMGSPAGNVYLYRIRSPFGWDSVYGFSESAPTSGLEIEVTCNDTTITVSNYPYEWSFYKFGYNEDINLKIRVLNNEQVIATKNEVFEGSSSTGIKDVSCYQQDVDPFIYTLSGIKLLKITSPGLYIVNRKKVFVK
jgi:hypothetical protein